MEKEEKADSNPELEALLLQFMHEQAFKHNKTNNNREIHYMGPECKKAMEQAFHDSIASKNTKEQE